MKEFLLAGLLLAGIGAAAGCGSGGGSSVDTTPPTVVQTSPALNATGVAATVPVTATFSETLDNTSITSATFTLESASHAPVYGAVAVSGASATFRPFYPLDNDTTYTATIGGTARDLAGNLLGMNHSWTFTVASTGTVSGTASIVSTGRLDGINVLLPALRRKTVTDVSGNFSFQGVPAGTYVVQAEDNAYLLNDRKSITVNAGQTVNVTLSVAVDPTVGTLVGKVPRNALHPVGKTITASVRGNFLFLGDHEGGAPIVDVSDPANPVVRSIIPTFPHPGLLGASTTIMTHCTDDGNYLGIVNNVDGFLYYDITDKSVPRLIYQNYLVDAGVGGQDPSSWPDYPYTVPAGKAILFPSSVIGRGDTLYVGGQNALLVYDISRRSAPVLLKEVTVTGDVADLHLHNDLLLCSSSDLLIYDISTPRDPALIGSFTPAGGWAPVGAAGAGPYIGLSTIGNPSIGIDGIVIVDASDPTAPSQDFSDNVVSQGIDASWDGYFYAATYDRMTVYRANPSSGSFEKVYTAPVNEDYAMNVAVSGDYAYVSDKTAGLKIVKIK